MDRRRFLESAGLMSAAMMVPGARNFATRTTAKPDAAEAGASGWRTFELTTRVEVLKRVA